MKSIFVIIKRFLPKYKGYAIANLIFNILGTVFNLFSFASIIPVLQILFGVNSERHVMMEWGGYKSIDSLADVAVNNAYALIENIMEIYGASTALLFLGLYLIIMTLLKTGCNFMSGATLVPIRTGVVRDLRHDLYKKIISLPIGYFTNERKGDIMTRMTSDVNEVEASIISSLETIFKNPLMIVIYMSVLFGMSWRLTVFVLILLPVSGLLIGWIGKSLKKKSLREKN